MYITGNDCVLYSNTSIFLIKDKFEMELKKKWGENNIIIQEKNETDRTEFFYAKNDSMLKHHHNKGYAIDDNGESCILLIGNRFERLNADIIIPTQNNFYDPAYITDAYTSRLMLIDVWEYTLVLPSLITTDLYSKCIYDILVNLLSFNQPK